MKTFIKDRLEEVILPARLVPGDKIGIAAPASPFESETFKQGLKTLRSMGFDPVVPQGLFDKEGYLAGTDQHRVDQLHELFLDDTVKAIFCARGGFGSLRMLSSLDYDLIRANPKIFMGFSDISTLLSAISQHSGLVTFHGPMVTTLAEADMETQNAILSAVSTGQNLTIGAKPWITLGSGSGTGPVAGGNLTTLCHLVGTPFEPAWKGHILLLEDLGEAVYRIDRMLTQLKLAGCLDGVAGLILGSFKDCGDQDAIYRLAMDLFEYDGLPIAAGFGIGHGSANMTLPLGLVATLDADQGTLTYHSAATAGE